MSLKDDSDSARYTYRVYLLHALWALLSKIRALDNAAFDPWHMLVTRPSNRRRQKRQNPGAFDARTHDFADRPSESKA